MEECNFTPRIGRAPIKSQFRSKSCKGLKAELTSWQKRELLDMQECTFQPNLHKGVNPSANHNAWPQHRPFRRDTNGFLRGEFNKSPVATGNTPRHLPGGDTWGWQLRSRSAEPDRSTAVVEKPAMQFGDLFEKSDHSIHE